MITLRRKCTSLDEKKQILFNEAFSMEGQSSLCDGDRELLGSYLDSVSERTIQRHYAEFIKSGSFNIRKMDRIYKSARRLYDKVQ